MQRINNRLLLIFIFAFLIRLIALDQSLWLDEATTARVVQQFTLPEIVTKFSAGDFHPPLYYLFMKLWTGIFGFSEVSLRFPSLIFSILVGYIVYKIAELMKGHTVGTWAAALFLFNPLIVYYSQEARMYMMVTFFLTSALYYLEKTLHQQKNALLFSVFAGLSLLTFYGSIFLIMAMALYLLYKKEFKILFFLLSAVAVSLLILSPLLYQQLVNAKKQLILVPNWTSVLGMANLKNLLLIPLKFSVGRISFEPKWLYWIVTGTWTAFVWLLAIRNGLKNRFLLFLIFVSLGLAVVFSFFTPLLQYFRFLYLLPIVCILLAKNKFTPINPLRLRLSEARHLIGTGFLIFSLIYLLFPAFHREDWKSLSNGIKGNKVFMVYTSSDPLKYYRDDLEIIDLKSLDKKKPISDSEIWVVPYTAEIHGVNQVELLQQQRFFLADRESYRGLVLERWTRTLPR